MGGGYRGLNYPQFLISITAHSEAENRLEKGFQEAVLAARSRKAAQGKVLSHWWPKGVDKLAKSGTAGMQTVK